MAKRPKSEQKGSPDQESQNSRQRKERGLSDISEDALKGRIKLSRFYQALAAHWHQIKKLNLNLTNVSDVEVRERIRTQIQSEGRLTKEKFGELLDLSAPSITAYVMDDTTLDFLKRGLAKPDHGIGQVLEQLSGQEKDLPKADALRKGQEKDSSTADAVRSDLLNTAIKSDTYYECIDLLSDAFGTIFKWQEGMKNYAEARWIPLPKETSNQPAPGVAQSYVSPLPNYLSTELSEHFSSGQWYMYTNCRSGIHRMAIEIDTTQGGAKMRIYDRKPMPIGESKNPPEPAAPDWEGEVYTGTHQQIIALLVNHGNTGMYAHLILFLTEAAKDSEQRTAYFGHFTYFSTNTNVRKYVTKIAVLDKYDGADPLSLVGLDIKGPDSKRANEKIIYRYLVYRSKSRLSSIQENLFSIAKLGEWLKKRNPDEALFRSCKGTYKVLYIKRRDLTSDSYQRCQDQVTLDCGIYPEHLDVTYEHSQTHPKQNGATFKGQLRHTASVLYGLLNQEVKKPRKEQNGSSSEGEDEDDPIFQEEVPIYLTIHTQGRHTWQKIEYLIGSLTGKRDGQDVIVTYACVLIPSDIADQPNNIEIVYDYLEREAKAGYAMVDPLQKRVLSFKISDLLPSASTGEAK